MSVYVECVMQMCVGEFVHVANNNKTELEKR